MKENFDFVFSLGESCRGSIALRALKLQAASYPFDWVGGGDILTRGDLLMNNFSTFIDKDYLNKTGEENINFYVYKNTLNNLSFVHDFMKNKTFEDNYLAVMQKYNRRYTRLLDTIEKSKKILVLYTTSYPDEELGDIKITLNTLLDKLNNRFHNKFFRIIYVQCLDKDVHSYEYIEKNMHILKIQDRTENQAFKYIFRNYKILVKNKSLIKSIIYNVLKIIINFIPDKNLRAQIRDFYRFK